MVVVDISDSLAPPSGLEAMAVNETAIELSWKPSTSGLIGPVTHYTVLYAAFTVSADGNLSRLSPDDPATSSIVRY